ncbi:SsgA family sporulation/cell division regulator [Streptomyces xanthochromogenes]|uniref:SsgA family sporulation/cell division regulator n=1 Tax=Streptomyces xanthochromogenes TaxID=67384 RepID=UPI00381DA265
MNNATTTSANDDFDALLEASSLGSLRVTSAIGATPPDARRRFEHAARSPETYNVDTEAASGQHVTYAPLHEPLMPTHVPVEHGRRPITQLVIAGQTGSGKTAGLAAALQYACTAGIVASDDASARRKIFLVERGTLAALLCVVLDAEEEAHAWTPSALERLADLLTTRPAMLAAPPAALEPPASRKLDTAPTDRPSTGFTEFAARIQMRMLLSLPGSPDRPTDHGLLQWVRTPPAQWTSVKTARRAHNAVLPLSVIDDEIDQLMAPAPLLTDSAKTQMQVSLLDGYVRMQEVAREALRRTARMGWAQPDAQQQPWSLSPADRASSMRPDNGKITRLRELWNICPSFPQDVRSVPMTWYGAEQYLSISERLLHTWRLSAAGRLESVALADECHSSRPMLLHSAMQGLPWLIVVAAPSLGAAPSPLRASEPRDVGVLDSDIIPVHVETPSTKPPGSPRGTAVLPRRQFMHAEITGRLHVDREGIHTLPLVVRFRYRATDPYAVEAVFGPDDMDVTWVFARELLAAGVHAKTGDGDVTVWPGLHGPAVGPWIYIELKPPSGTALLSLPRARVEEFLNETNIAVPPGTEERHLACTLPDFESQLTQLTGNQGRSD